MSSAVFDYRDIHARVHPLGPFTRIHSCSTSVHSSTRVDSYSLVLYSCSTRVLLVFTLIHSCSTRVHLYLLVFYSCSLLFTCVLLMFTLAYWCSTRVH